MYYESLETQLLLVLLFLSKWSENHFLTNAHFGTNMYYESLEIQLFSIIRNVARWNISFSNIETYYEWIMVRISQCQRDVMNYY